MSQSAESSVVVSLTELMRAEEGRIRAEEERARQRVEQERAARSAEERALREREARRVAEEVERRRLIEAREREEAARLEAIRAAAIERARLEAQVREVPPTMGGVADGANVRRQLRVTVAVLGVALVAWALSLAGAFVWLDRRSDLRAWDLARQYGAAEQTATETRHGLEEKLRVAVTELETARSEIQKLEKALLDVKKPAPPKLIADPPLRPPEVPCPVCPEGDPLCSDLRCRKATAPARH